MRKEIFFAILAGGAFGLLIAYGAWKLNSSFKPKPTESTNATSTSSPTQTSVPSTGELKIVLTKPNNKQVMTITPTSITGVTAANSYVVVSGMTSENIINSNASGAFDIPVDLEGGANQIVITALKDTGETATTNLLLVFSSQFTVDAANSAVPQAYIGTVTDITNSIIQIKNESGDIEQIAASEKANFIKLTNNTNKTIAQTDVAIGDYLIAMGIKGSNNILSASRFLITDPIVKTTRRAFIGTVTDSSEVGKISIKNTKTNEAITVTPSDDITVDGLNRFSDIDNNMKLIVVGEFKDGSIEARTIKVLK